MIYFFGGEFSPFHKDILEKNKILSLTFLKKEKEKITNDKFLF
jgi:hypothetical protein